jgi:hypothetical protein
LENCVPVDEFNKRFGEIDSTKKIFYSKGTVQLLRNQVLGEEGSAHNDI